MQFFTYFSSIISDENKITTKLHIFISQILLHKPTKFQMILSSYSVDI